MMLYTIMNVCHNGTPQTGGHLFAGGPIEQYEYSLRLHEYVRGDILSIASLLET